MGFPNAPIDLMLFDVGWDLSDVGLESYYESHSMLPEPLKVKLEKLMIMPTENCPYINGIGSRITTVVFWVEYP